MNPERGYRALGCLLRAGLWLEPQWEEGVFPLKEDEWESLYVLAGKQAVQGVVWDGIRLLPPDWAPPRKCLAQWLLAVQRIAERHADMEQRMEEQAVWWNRKGLTSVMLKGHGVAAMYPCPEHRVCGDIDWYFPAAQEWEAASRLAEKKGAALEGDSDGDVHYTWGDTLVEHHRNWVHLSRPSSIQILKALEKEEGYEEWNGKKVLAPLPNLLLLNTHILKHALVLGIGLRQLCDLAMAYRHYEGRYDAKRLKQLLGQLGLLKWTAVLHTVLVEVLGMPVRYLPYPLEQKEKIAPLMQQIWKDGNFGMYREEKQRYTEMKRRAKAKYVLTAWWEKATLFWKYAPQEWVWRPWELLKNRVKRNLPQDLGSQLAWMGRLVRPYRKKLGGTILLELVGMGLSLAAIFFSKKAIDIATGSVDGSLWGNAAWMVGCILGSMLIGIFTPWLTEKVYLKFQMVLQTRLNDRLIAASWKETQQWHTGDILNRMTKDGEEVVQLVVYTLPSVVVTLVKLVASFGFLCWLDVRIAWMILASTPLLLLSKIYYKRMRQLSCEWKKNDSRIVSLLQENMVARMLIASLGAEEVRRSLLQEGLTERYRTGMEQLKFGTYSKGVLRTVFNGGYFLAFLLGLYYLSKKLISFGTMMAFIQLVNRVQGPVLQLIGFVPGLIRVRASLERIKELDDCTTEQKRGNVQLEQLEELEVKDVHFGYHRRKVIDGMKWTFQSGKPVAIVGPTGVGKTTLIRLIAGILEPDEGHIVVKGDGTEWETGALHRLNFVYVPQGNSLFSGTIRENLQVVDPYLTEERIQEVLQLACVDFIPSLPQGLDTEIGEKGFGLSEGQAQRLAVARALLLPGKIWIFDEITSALDTRTAQQLVRNVMAAGKEKIVLFVTHDPALKACCSQVLDLEKA